MQRKIYSFFTLLMLLMAVGASAQEIRYVSKQGQYSNDGKSWSTAKANIQDAINDLVDNGLTGEVWVAAGTYTPTESTESSGGSTLYMSFKIPAGISVYGGFEGTETSKDQREMNTTRSIGSVYKNATILSGDLSSAAKFTWNRTKDQWNTSFYGNCYHVVFFATNGFDATGRAKSNGGGYKSAMLEGCIIEHGNAYNSDIAGRPHNAYGGGVYMVEGSYLLNCMVRQCVAYRDGGGIYMDGGGYVEHTGVTDCQTLGIGTTYGYGGGVCMNGPATYTSANPMILRRSGIFGCVARMGGGISIVVNDTLGNNKYKLACTSVVVANNTATTEAGGVYMNRGGAITQMTVVNNKCNGAGVITNGMANGRAASIYCRDNAIIANSVMWGGLCAANNNIQFASSRSGNSSSLNPYMMYSSLTHSDYTDWSGVTKREVAKLSEYNTSADGTANASEGYPMFYHPTPNAGYVSSAQAHQFLYGGTSTIASGVTLYDATGNKVDAADIKLGTTYYIDANQKTVAEEGTHYTYLGEAYDFQPESRSSINHKGVITADLDRYGQTPAFEVDLDVMGRRFTPRPTNGAYTSSTTTIAPEVTTDAAGTTVYNFYVDPEDDRGTEYVSIGSSWDQPVRFLADALNYIKDQNYPATATVNVYVKQGTVNNTTTSVVGRIRTITIDIPSNVHLYGGYASENTGTSLKVRNPNTYVTTISAEAQGIYDLNVAHLLNFNGTKNTMIDGFSIRRANARSTEMIEGTPVTTGAAMTFTNASEVVIRNCGVANNTASQGAVANLISSEVHFENCIFHNNESRELNANGTVKSITGNILVGSGSKAVFSHCNFIRNVGNAIDTYGKVTTVNSMFYGNMSEPLEDTRNNADKALVAVRLFTGGSFAGDHNLYDAKSADFITNNSLDATNEAILDYKFSDTSITYPRFLNPTKNAGVSTSGDVTYYGRTISFQPHNNNPMVNRASTVDYQGNATSDHTKWGTDMTGIYTRDYGGLPDIGAVENHEGTVADEGEKAYPNGQRPYGGALYVRDYRDSSGNIDTSIDGRDGSSWGSAINGNGTYTSTTVTGGTPTTPQASTIDNPVTYKIGKLTNATPGNTVNYAKSNGDTYIGNTTDYNSGDDFIIINASNGYYYIYDVTKKKYVVWTEVREGNSKVVFSDTNTSKATWRLYSVNASDTYHTYCIQPSTTNNSESSLSWNYHGGTTYNLGLYSGTDGNSKWQFMIPKTSTSDVNGFQYAINLGNTQWQEDSTSLREVRVGAGTYYANLEWKAGVNVRGGYPAMGNPGEHERNISNSNSDYQTIIDAQNNGRVLLMPDVFYSQATFEGFTIQNGFLTGWDYGAGVYLRSGGILKNCLVQNNMFSANSSTGDRQGGGGIYMNTGSIVKNCKIMKNTVNANSRNIYIGGAGVYAAGGTLINSLIVENTTISSYWLLGAGFYIAQVSSLYNCTIAYNYGNSGSTTYAATGGVWDASGNSSLYNSIIWGNYATGSTPENMVQVGISGYSSGGGVNKNLYTCYSSAWSKKYSSDDVSDANKVLVVGTGSDGTRSDYQTFYNNCKEKEPFVRDANGNTDYSLKATATQCINKGSEFDALDTYDITVDINGEDRIQDCTIDKGAYEYNQSLDITPEEFTTTGATSKKAVFYVTPEGHGTASADSPTNAACASKLQKVLDAAGRYKYQNPTDTVIVKVANSKTLQQAGEYFQYYACRTTDEMDQSVRVWSIIVPRGVEVWGGYTDTYTSADDNGFYTKDTATGTITDNRNITGNPTYFDSYYYNKYEKQNANTYHVVTFTDRVFDGEGNPYKTGDKVGDPSSWTEGDTDYLSMKTGAVTDRAVIDGLYITGGNADAQVTNLANTDVNINQYGGAAIVTDYAHVRNCIVQGNSATYGGALALTHNALVSGCLIDQNTADYGGAIYMFENGTKLSDGTVIDTKPEGTVLDEKMAHVYTSTIVNNTANSQGGGIWFGQDEENINIRVNSSVVWQNSSSSQANVSGLFNPTKAVGNTATTMQFYPFAYCAVQNLRLSGVNNIQLANLNSAGVRFADKNNAAGDQQTLAKETSATDFTRFSNFGYYGLTNYSVLVRTGMPVSEYTALMQKSGLSATDFMNMDRQVSTTNNRSYIEMGARALDKVLSNGQLMLRLFVAKPEDVNMDAAQTMMNLVNTAKAGSVEEYYSQEGSSFAYPMQNLQDAIDYIIEKRSYNADSTALNQPGANNLPFEIFIAQGTYYPTRNLAGVYGNSPGNSFLIPEGVSLYGSFAVGNANNANTFYGRYYTANSDPDNYTEKIDKNVTAVADTLVTLNSTYKITQKSINDLYQLRTSNDNNGNNIIEPWEFANQTILSGDVENSQHNGVYHVIQIVADQNVVGMLPKRSESHEEASTVYLSPSYAEYTKKMGAGSFDYEEGQTIILDGVQITGGMGMNYIEGSTTYMSKYNYYSGGGVMVDGNRYCDDYNKGTKVGLEYKHAGIVGAVGYRDIPLIVAHCKFIDNTAGLGGALCSNGTVNLYMDAFEQNRAQSGTDQVLDSEGNTVTVNYAGIGGAVAATHQFSAYNTLFANNEAYDKALDVEGRKFTNLSIHDDNNTEKIGGVGGAAYIGPFGYFHIVNCDLVRNQANLYPAVYTRNPNKDYTGTRNEGIGSDFHPSTVYYNQFVNTVIWGNDINDEMSQKYDSDSKYPRFKFNSRLICNYAPGEYDSYGVPDFTSSSTNSPADQEALDEGSNEAVTAFGETAWFCAYEEGRGITPLNDADFRASEYNPFQYVRDIVHGAGLAFTPAVNTYQNCNIQLAADNLELEGPNFINPSNTPGYAGYNESADWSPARINNLVDNGSGQISQTITLEGETYKASFVKYTADSELPNHSIYNNSENPDGYTTENLGDYKTEGAYPTTRVLYGYEHNRLYMPEGELFYMKSAATGQQLYRISYDPNPTHNQTYIDIGVYEYPHTELSYTTDGDEVDILWVSPQEKPDNGLPDGSAWSQPTSDLQRAIETLLASRNGHRKEIRLMNGTYTPIYSINDKLAFTIDTKALNQSVVLPVKSTSDGNVEYVTGKGVVSLTIKGGYSEELNNVYDPEQYPAVMRQQARTNESSDRWDHLLYISDPTQRYGYDPKVGYTEDNGYGHYTGDSGKKVVNTIPIHIDGVSMVNNQALPGVKGAAIHYSDVADSVTSPTAAHVSVNQYYSEADTTQVSEDNEPTLHFNRQVENYYTDATYTTVSETPTAFVKYKYVENATNKIIISKSKIMNSGSWKYATGDYTASAVYIGKNGGNALLYNDVMHSNWGNPLVSAVNTTVVNNTYALNKGYVNLNDETTRSVAITSSIFNSVFWRNNNNGTQFAMPGYVSPSESGDIFSHNAVTGFRTDVTDYSLDVIPNENYNVGLSDVNNDVINGPNFTDPKESATTSKDIEARDFSLQPSLRLLNKGSDDLYQDNLTKYPDTYNIYDLAWVTTLRMDAAGEQRFCYDIDLGAYEYQNNLNRIIYVNPNIGVSGLGNTWADPVAYGNLQAAIDLASVYHVNNTGEEAYVFVKGAGSNNTDLHLGETITMRNGVSIYGSILPTRTEDCTYTTHEEKGSTMRTYKQEDIDAYVATLTAERNGVANPTANRTTIGGIKVPASTKFDDTSSNIVALVDGFDVTATNSSNPTGAITEPVIDIEPMNEGANVALRNLIVHDNDASGTAGVNIANVNNALIYEALFRDNKVSTTGNQLHIMSNGYGVNLTVEGKTMGANGKSTYNGAGDADHIYYSLVNYAGQAATENTLSGYNYKVSDKNLNYQLTEQSQHIDQCAAANPIANVASLAQFINYDTDRDLLGNPRLLKGVSSKDMIDRGAFETWRVDQDVETTSKDKDGANTNYYPHQGSVVYIMKGKSLVLEPYEATTDANGVVTANSGTALRPAYLLVQDGASLYGNGNTVAVGYVGLERTASSKGSMVSMPYAMQYKGTDAATNGVGIPSYNATTGVLSITNATGAEAYTYNGVGRSAWNSAFYDTQSAYWTSLSDKATDANTGVLYKPVTENTYRFTAQGDADDMSKYVYTERVGETAKTVTLTQHDDRTSTNGGADFTEKEDMGWNCFGLPWLVSNYDPAAKEELTGDSHYNMDIPHTLWLWYDGKTYPDGTTAADGDGGYYSVSSWDTTDWHLATGEQARIWAGEGIFTQTAAVSDTENLMFYRPVYAKETSAKANANNAAEAAKMKTTAAHNARYYATDGGIADDNAQLDIRVRGRVIYVTGLQGGEDITVYDTQGRIYNMERATGEQYSTAVPTSGVYIIRVDNTTKKVAVK